ncbi:MAG: glycoside hydrolase family 43 protein [Treponema sp.]|nr:glycoside hydrolase family 43 protein [Treponema sp.]MCL2180813.1 glycoside hydrolase family 43 protein [Treponema sp.]
MIKKINNPIQSGFYPDPSICRAGSDFYLVNSTFAYFPGLPIFKSRDLVHWKQIGNAIDRPGQLCFDKHKISQGLFAPTIRENNGMFYILCTLINTGGNFIITAKDPAGPWSDPVWLKGADGIDPSIFFDPNGTVWYCGTRAAPEGQAYQGNYEVYIIEIDLALLAEGKNPLKGESKGIWRGALRDVIWPEGPHIYKIQDYYYLLHAEGGTGIDHAVCIARAKDIRGPWEGKRSNPLLTHRHLGRRASIINAGHADIVDDKDGNWWMVLLASRPYNGVCPLGRETFFVPVKWEGAWPYIATESGMIEEQIEINCDESAASGEWRIESCCDHFTDKLPLHWLTLRMPVNEKDIAFSLTERKGVLRLYTKPETMRGNGHPAFAGRRIRHKDWAFTVSLEFSAKDNNEAAGLVLLQSEDFMYRLECCLINGKQSIRLVKAAGKDDEVLYTGDFPGGGTPFVFAAVCEDMKISFFYGCDKYSLTCIADNADARILSTEYAGGFVGSIAGVFSSANGKISDNYADVLWAEYRGI